jgi:hypothetical protein
MVDGWRLIIKQQYYCLPPTHPHTHASYVTTDGQSASLSWCQGPIWGLEPDFCYCQIVADLFMWGALSEERTGLPFTIAAGPRQRSHSWVGVLRDLWPYFTVSDSKLSQPGGSGPRIYILQEQDGQVISPGTGFPTRRLLRFAGLRWIDTYFYRYIFLYNLEADLWKTAVA